MKPEYYTGVQAFPGDAAQIALAKLADEYQTRTEAYDRTVCTGPIVNGAIRPASSAEVRLILLNARAVSVELGAKAAGLGFTSRQWFAAKVAASGRMRS